MGNAKPHISKKSSEKLKDLGIELVPHPPHSPDLAPSDYHVFRSMQSFFADRWSYVVEHNMDYKEIAEKCDKRPTEVQVKQ
ncbi:hypothetical protein ANCCEY_11356 [Ancylostoma ceylanicum]|uniref:Tc1-like transposase DDE domain-containing protein n=1 Tax=Ancylostoma ceylanicum TaxID=53326 RepID=A0A0D6LBT8_9BILA|nr:hypothetical protein ANCCEY_11356 [Ancylostoma ceylanicum]